MKKDAIARCNLTIFGVKKSSFFMNSLENLLVNYPFLEQHLCWDIYSFVYIEKGDGAVTVDDTVIRVDEPKVIFIKPNQMTVFDISRRTKGMIIYFKEDFFALRYNNNVLQAFSFFEQGVKPFQRLNENQNFRVKTIIELMQHEFGDNTPFQLNVLRSYLNILLFEIQKLCAKNGIKDVKTMFVHEKMINFENALNTHFAQSRLPSFYAKLLHISESYLNRLCKQYRGKSAGEVIRERVCIEAQRLLLHTQMSVAQVADTLGFDSVSYFVTFFKKQFDKTPETFRKQ
jgi:AraC-like DNA-binding protein